MTKILKPTIPHVEVKRGISEGLPIDYKIEHPGTSDAIFYNLFSNKNIAAAVMSILEGITIRPEDIEYRDKDFKSSIYRSAYLDMRFTIADYADVNLEMQNEMKRYGTLSYEQSLMHRLIKYSGYLLVESTEKGDESYIKRPIHIVCFANFTYNNIKEVVKTYFITDDSHKSELDVLKYAIIFIPNLIEAEGELKNWLELLVTNEPLRFRGRNRIMDEAIDVLLSCDGDSSVREYYRQKKMAEDELQIQLNSERFWGREEGTAEGRAERIKAIKSLYQMGIGLEDIQKAFGISLDEVNEILGV